MTSKTSFLTFSASSSTSFFHSNTIRLRTHHDRKRRRRYNYTNTPSDAARPGLSFGAEGKAIHHDTICWLWCSSKCPVTSTSGERHRKLQRWFAEGRSPMVSCPARAHRGLCVEVPPRRRNRAAQRSDLGLSRFHNFLFSCSAGKTSLSSRKLGPGSGIMASRFDRPA
jgi:hypothetical protein